MASEKPKYTVKRDYITDKGDRVIEQFNGNLGLYLEECEIRYDESVRTILTRLPTSSITKSSYQANCVQPFHEFKIIGQIPNPEDQSFIVVYGNNMARDFMQHVNFSPRSISFAHEVIITVIITYSLQQYFVVVKKHNSSNEYTNPSGAICHADRWNWRKAAIRILNKQINVSENEIVLSASPILETEYDVHFFDMYWPTKVHVFFCKY